MKELDLIAAQLERVEERQDKMLSSIEKVSTHCATLLERTVHMATRDDVTAAIRTHTGDCRTSRLPKNGTANRQLLKAVAAILTSLAAALAAWFGFHQ